MSTMQAEVYEAFRAINVPEEKAIRAAEAMGKAADLPDLRRDISGLQREGTVIKWMVGTCIGLCLLLLGSMFTMGSKLGEMSGTLAQIAKIVH